MKPHDRPTSYFSETLEKIIEKKEHELKSLARKHAQHLAGKNLPALVGDSLAPYLGHLKAECESLAALVHQHLLPTMHKSERKIESDFASKENMRLDAEIQNMEHENHNREFEREHFDASVYHRILLAGIIGIVICIGDTVYNIQSFEAVTDNLLFAMLFSLGCSVAALSLAHFIPMLYKKLTTRFGRITFGGAITAAVMLFFSALSVFRSQFLQGSGVTVDSGWFIVINMVFFLATMLVSALLLPTWEELQKNWKQIKLRIAISKQKRKIRNIFRQKEKLRIAEKEHEKHCARISHYRDSCNHRIKKLFADCAQAFTCENIAYRSDNKVPDCVNEPLPDIDVNPKPQKPHDQ